LDFEFGAEKMDILRKMKCGIPGGVFAISALVVGFSLVGGRSATAALLPLGQWDGQTDSNDSVTFVNGSSPVGQAPYLGATEGPLFSETGNLLDTSNPSIVMGTLTSQIYLDASNHYEFVYQVTNSTNDIAPFPNSPFPDSFDSVTISSFGPMITTAVGYNNPGGTVDPASANRDAANNLNWDFTTAYGLIGPGETSDYLIVDTNTNSYNNHGLGSVIDDITGEALTQIPVFMPSVPEPATAGLAILAGGMFLGRRRRR
jgi:hypothetical protein